jgi:hypothetical protein
MTAVTLFSRLHLGHGRRRFCPLAVTRLKSCDLCHAWRVISSITPLDEIIKPCDGSGYKIDDAEHFNRNYTHD